MRSSGCIMLEVPRENITFGKPAFNFSAPYTCTFNIDTLIPTGQFKTLIIKFTCFICNVTCLFVVSYQYQHFFFFAAILLFFFICAVDIIESEGLPSMSYEI